MDGQPERLPILSFLELKIALLRLGAPLRKNQRYMVCFPRFHEIKPRGGSLRTAKTSFPVVLVLSFCILQIHGFAETSHENVIKQAAVLARAGKLQQAEVLLRSASAANPDSGTLHGDLGELLFEEHKYSDAAVELGQAAQQKPDSREYNLMAAEALIGWQHYATAVDFLRAIQPRFGNDFMYHYDLGLAYYYVGNINQAVVELEKSLQLSPNFERAKFLLANCLGYGDAGKAIEIFRKLASEHPENSFYWASLGDMQRQAGNAPEALKAVRKALALSPGDLYVQLAAAAVFVQTGDYASGRPLLEHLEKADPKVVNVHALLARIYARTGDSERARKEAEVAKQLRMEESAHQGASAQGPPGSAASK